MLHHIRHGGVLYGGRTSQRLVPRTVPGGLLAGLFAGLLLGLLPLPIPAPALFYLGAQVGAPSQPPQKPPASPAPQTSPPAAASPAAPALPDSLLDQPAQPAQIQFSAKALTIHADNSSLGAILHDIAAKTGMQLQGFGGDERVFGSFGPGAPRAVLADLLNGTPYNLVMVGDLSNGAPRQLILSPSTPGGPTPPPAQNDADKDGQENAQPPFQPPEPGQRREIAPGMGQQPVRTPQQMLQELERMRQQQAGQPPQ